MASDFQRVHLQYFRRISTANRPRRENSERCSGSRTNKYRRKTKGGPKPLCRIDEDRFSDSYQFVMKTYSVTEAKAKLGPLADLALKKRPIFIRRGQRMLQLVEATMPEPIPLYPEGHFAVGEDRAEYLNSLPIDSTPLER